MADRKPYHRRTLDETCETCGQTPGAVCTDLRTVDPQTTKNLHRYQPTTGTP